MHYNFCGRDGHLESRCFENMEALKAAMKKHNINLDSSSSNSSCHGHALYTFGFSFNATFTSSFDESLIESIAFFHMAKDKAIFCALSECNTK
jgi:hypothetical protein